MVSKTLSVAEEGARVRFIYFFYICRVIESIGYYALVR